MAGKGVSSVRERLIKVGRWSEPHVNSGFQLRDSKKYDAKDKSGDVERGPRSSTYNWWKALQRKGHRPKKAKVLQDAQADESGYPCWDTPPKTNRR